jgi:predicted nucleotidyltransferase
MEKLIVEFIKNCYPKLKCIYIYGSYATGTDNANSDIDVCVLMPKDVKTNRHDFELNKKISEQLKKEINIVFCTKQNSWCEKLIYKKK